jgi:hypothetical protein
LKINSSAFGTHTLVTVIMVIVCGRKATASESATLKKISRDWNIIDGHISID